MPSLAAWFSPSLQTISRSAGRSSVLAAAYRACEKLTDERLGITRDFTPKGKHGLASNICIGIPNDNIALLFNNAEKAETRANSTVARELMVPLSSEWSDHERRECVRAIAQMLRDEYGVAVLASIHRPARDNNNDHAHILFTTRTVDTKGVFGKKTRILDDAKTGEVKKMREAVCEIVNKHALANGNDWYVYAGKFSDVLEDHIPTTHISISHGKNQKQYIDANRENVKEAQAVIAKTKADIAANDVKIAELTAQATIEESSQKTAPPPDTLKTVPVPVEAHVSKIDLKRIEIPANAIKARDQLEKALFSRQTLHQQFTAWEEMHEKLLAKPPTPEYGFFGGPKASYKKALFEYSEDLEAATVGMAECTNRATALIDYIKNPERKRLHNIYCETIAHNANVQKHEMQMAHENEQSERLDQKARKAASTDNAAANFLASLQAEETQVSKVRDRGTKYSSGGMSM